MNPTPWKTIYEIMDEKYFDELKVKYHKDFLMICNSEFKVPQFIPLKTKKKI